jgi:hypothetical protein
VHLDASVVNNDQGNLHQRMHAQVIQPSEASQAVRNRADKIVVC